MKIILPMVGEASEFEREFGIIKPLVNICGKTMIEQMCSMFPNKQNILFLCRKNDIENSKLVSVLGNISGCNTNVIAVDCKTENVLETLMFADGHVNDGDEILIAHFDSYSQLNFPKFVAQIKEKGEDGIITAFSGFSPYDKMTANYGRLVISGCRVIRILEKRLLENGQLTAAGCYYFSSWGMFKVYARKILSDGSSRSVFISEVYNRMMEDNKKIGYYIVDFFINYNSPKDVKEFVYWSEVFSLNNRWR